LSVERASPLARRTTMRVGGLAELWVEVATAGALAELRRACAESGTALLVLGRGANVLVPDEGLAGVVARLGGDFEAVTIEGELAIAGAAVTLAQLARRAVRQGLGGLEALAGFPASVGGAVAMNAGCYGVEVKDVLVWADVLEADGSRRRLEPADLEAGYRETCLPRRGAVVVAAAFRLVRGERAVLERRLEELNRRRWSALPSGQPNSGSIFRNPQGDFAGRLIEACGLKGRASGGACISERHGNVIVNLGTATAADVLSLMQLARREVAARFDIVLEPEITLLGSLRAAWDLEAAGDGCATIPDPSIGGP
jgi:UDP-N-acetylmuramate dehydrogenase